ncbi:hypothetical protein Tco_1050858 [Tanacetum coccineum]
MQPEPFNTDTDTDTDTDTNTNTNTTHCGNVHLYSPSSGILFSSLKAHPEKVPEPRPEIKKSVKLQPHVLEPSPVTKKVMEVHRESVLNPTLETKKSMEAQPEIVLEPSPEVKKAMEVQQESILKKKRKKGS